MEFPTFSRELWNREDAGNDVKETRVENAIHE